MRIARGDVFRVNLDPTVGSETRKTRPCVVVQRDAANRTSPTTIVCPMTDARGSRGTLLDVFVAANEGGLTKDSIVLCNQIRTVDARRLVERLGELTAPTMASVSQGLRRILELEPP